MMAVLAALPQELGPLRARLRATASGPGVWERDGPRGMAILALTGMGAEACKRATKRLLDRYQVKALISTGFAGALSESLRPGQVIISSSVRAPGDVPVIHLDEALMKQALAIGEPRAVTSVTVPSAANTRKSREALRTAYRAEAVDMESYWIAEAARRRGIPCLVIRAVLDTVEQEIPELETEAAGPGASLLLLLAFMRSPRSLASLPSLWIRSRLAAARLAIFITGFLDRYAETCAGEP
jgi:nucleoside phosphorylase